MAFETILTETRGKVGLITLNRPQALNALNSSLLGEVNQALDTFEADPNIGCIVITGSEKAFAAGADIKEMAELNYPHTYMADFFSGWEKVSGRRKPMIAAVAGFALGGASRAGQNLSGCRDLDRAFSGRSLLIYRNRRR